MKHSSLQDYQEQLLLLERPCQNYNRPTMQQGQDSGIADADFKSIAQIDSTKSDDERKKELRDYQMSLMNLSCRQRKGHPMLSSHQPTSSQGTANISPSDTDLVASWHAEDVSRDLDFDTTPSQDGKGIQDALQDFNFDSFLRQDGMGADSADYKHNITGREVKKAPACQNPAARTKTQEYDAASVIVPIRSKLQSITPEITQVNLEKPLLFVNPKQFHRIIVRRVARQKPRTTVASQPSKSPRRHGLHAQRRPRGPSGRFLTLKEILQQAEKREEGIIQGVKGQPDRFSDLQLIKTLGDRLMMIGNDGRASSRTQIWWVAYTSLQESDLATYASITSELESKIGVFESDPSPYKWLWSMMPAKPISRDRHELKEIVALRNSIINVVVTVDKQLGLEIATVGWACVYVCLALNEHNVSYKDLTPSAILAIEQCLIELREVVDVIARYAVMENFCQQPSGALALKPEYDSELIFLCTTILEYFSAFFSIEKNITGNGDLQANLKRCKQLAEKIRAMDKACQRFMAGVDMNAASESVSEEAGIEDMSDEGWVHVCFKEGRMDE